VQPDEPLRGVEKTALGVAMVRARESHRDDRLFDDPYAQAFVDAAPGAFPEEPKTPEELAALGPMASLGAVFYVHGVIRTRFFDDYLTAATAAGCSQVVLLAAGLDTRAFRLPWPQRTRVFEVDLPDVLAFKDSVLATQGAVPRCERTTVPADLRADWTAALTEAGFDRTSPAGWLAEGLLIYLSAAEAERLLDGHQRAVRTRQPARVRAQPHGRCHPDGPGPPNARHAAIHQAMERRTRQRRPALAHQPRMAARTPRTRHPRRRLSAPGPRPGPRRISHCHPHAAVRPS
jgi:methyltransferase (TIGR00027 family)